LHGKFEGEAAAALLPPTDESGKSKAMNEQWVLIDRRGRKIGKTVYAYLEAIGEGKFSANAAGESFLRILDVSGKTLFTVKPGMKTDGAFCLWANRGCHTEVGRFVDDIASYRSGADLVHENTDDMATHGYYYMGWKWGVLDGYGRVVVKPVYSFIGEYSEGLFAFATCGVDYPSCDDVPEGSFRARQFGYLDSKGEVIIQPKWSWAGSFENGLARVEAADPGVGSTEFDACWSYIDRSGKYVYEARIDQGKTGKCDAPAPKP
jgi:hypothetical protein